MSHYHALSLQDIPDNSRELSRFEFQAPARGFMLGIGYQKKKGIKFNREHFDALHKSMIAQVRAQTEGDYCLRYMLGTLVLGPSPVTIRTTPIAALVVPIKPVFPQYRFNSGNTLAAASVTALQEFSIADAHNVLDMAEYETALAAPPVVDLGILYVDPTSKEGRFFAKLGVQVALGIVKILAPELQLEPSIAKLLTVAGMCTLTGPQLWSALTALHAGSGRRAAADLMQRFAQLQLSGGELDDFLLQLLKVINDSESQGHPIAGIVIDAKVQSVLNKQDCRAAFDIWTAAISHALLMKTTPPQGKELVEYMINARYQTNEAQSTEFTRETKVPRDATGLNYARGYEAQGGSDPARYKGNFSRSDRGGLKTSDTRYPRKATEDHRRGGPPPRAEQPTASVPARHYKCFRCQGENHQSADCRYEAPQGKVLIGERSITCQYCKKPNHTAEMCYINPDRVRPSVTTRKRERERSRPNALHMASEHEQWVDGSESEYDDHASAADDSAEDPPAVHGCTMQVMPDSDALAEVSASCTQLLLVAQPTPEAIAIADSGATLSITNTLDAATAVWDETSTIILATKERIYCTQKCSKLVPRYLGNVLSGYERIDFIYMPTASLTVISERALCSAKDGEHERVMVRTQRDHVLYVQDKVQGHMTPVMQGHWCPRRGLYLFPLTPSQAAKNIPQDPWGATWQFKAPAQPEMLAEAGAELHVITPCPLVQGSSRTHEILSPSGNAHDAESLSDTETLELLEQLVQLVPATTRAAARQRAAILVALNAEPTIVEVSLARNVTAIMDRTQYAETSVEPGSVDISGSASNASVPSHKPGGEETTAEVSSSTDKRLAERLRDVERREVLLTRLLCLLSDCAKTPDDRRQIRAIQAQLDAESDLRLQTHPSVVAELKQEARLQEDVAHQRLVANVNQQRHPKKRKAVRFCPDVRDPPRQQSEAPPGMRHHHPGLDEDGFNTGQVGTTPPGHPATNLPQVRRSIVARAIELIVADDKYALQVAADLCAGCRTAVKSREVDGQLTADIVRAVTRACVNCVSKLRSSFKDCEKFWPSADGRGPSKGDHRRMDKRA